MNSPTNIAPAHRAGNTLLAHVVDSLGSRDFAAELMRWLYAVASAEHCVLYSLGQQVEVLGARSIDGTDFAEANAREYLDEDLWRQDSGFMAAYSAPEPLGAAVVRVRKSTSRNTRVRSQILEKLFLFGRRNHRYGLSVLRGAEHAHFSDREMRRLSGYAEVVLSCCDKHVSYARLARPRAAPLRTVAEIEQALAAGSQRFTERERQVCSRVLYGTSIPAIARELGIHPETVITYRKRAFVKAGVTTKHELLRQYLAA
ncbi:MAG: LuxR C-terminal-related transcriptional regulator [Lautropia sp.]